MGSDDDENNINRAALRKIKENKSMKRVCKYKAILEQGYKLSLKIERQLVEDSQQAFRVLLNKFKKVESEVSEEDRSNHSTEMMLDAHVLNMLHELQDRIMKISDSEYSDAAFVSAISKYVTNVENDDEENFDAICAEASQIPLTFECKPTMLGAIDSKYPDPIVKQRRVNTKSTLGDRTQPLQVSMLQRKDEGPKFFQEVGKAIYNLVKKNQSNPIPFYKLIIDPNDFSKNVYMCFAISHLLKEKKIAITCGNDGYPEVTTNFKNLNQKAGESHQAVCNIDAEIVAKMIKFYKIKEPMLKIKMK